MERETIETRYQDMDVVYDVRRETWTVKIDDNTALEESAVKAINPELYAGIARHMEHEVTEYQARKEREEAERKAKQDAIFAESLAKWTAQVKETMDELNTGLEWRIDAINEVVLSLLDRHTATISWNDKVYRSRGSWGHGEKTELVWVVRYMFKTKRFRTLEKAVKNVQKNFADAIETQRFKDERAARHETTTANIIEELAKDGLAAKEETRYVRDAYRRGRSTEYKEVIARKGHLIGKATNDADGLRIDNTRIVCRLTAGQFARLAEILESNEFATL